MTTEGIKKEFKREYVERLARIICPVRVSDRREFTCGMGPPVHLLQRFYFYAVERDV